MKTFYQLLANVLIVGTTTNFVWFALTFWIYLETDSVISTAFVGGLYLVVTALSGFWFGALVDNHKKKHVMLGASVASLIFFVVSFILYNIIPHNLFTSVTSVSLWGFSLLLLLGVIAGNIFNIAIPTLVTILVPQDRHDKANGMFGTVSGIGFALTSIASGFILAFWGMSWVLAIAILLTLTAIIHLLFVPIPEKKIVHLQDGKPRSIDIMGTITIIRTIPGLVALIFFNTFNNFLGGAFMALIDAYGLSLVSVEMWGTMLAVLSFGFIFGGLYISKKGLGKNPLKALMIATIIDWTICIFFAIQPSILLLGIGMLIWMSLSPFVEAAEQTIIQKVVPPERQGRVFGFAQSMEQAASPLTAFLIGPITQLIFIPYMTTGKGVDLIGSWFGVGAGRGIALVFIIAGIIGLFITILAIRSNTYRLLSKRYIE